MDLTNNAVEQREYLERNLERLNTIVSAVLGVKVELKIVEHTNYKKETHYSLEDNHNFRNKCGVMAKAFKEVTICSFGVWWKDQGVTIKLDFCYEYIDGGRNGANFCAVDIVDDFIKII